MVLQCAVVGKIMKKKFIIVFLLLLLVGLTGCNKKKETLKISDLEKYKNISISDIQRVEVDYITLLGGNLLLMIKIIYKMFMKH